MKYRQAFTLTSLLVSVALTGIVAAVVSQTFINQLTLTRVIDVIDRRSAIVDFYSDLLRDDSVWQCTLRHNTDLRDYVVNLSTLVTQGGLDIIAPDCSTVLAELAGRKLGDSLNVADANGWWTVSPTWSGVGKGAVDLTLEVSIDRNVFDAQHGFKLRQTINNKIIKVHRSENSTQVNNCRGAGYEEAVTSIDPHTALQNRRLKCSGADYRIIKTSSGCTLPHLIGNITDEGDIECTTGVAVIPFTSYQNTAPNNLSGSGVFTSITLRTLVETKDCMPVETPTPGKPNPPDPPPAGISSISSSGIVSCASSPSGRRGARGCVWPWTSEYKTRYSSSCHPDQFKYITVDGRHLCVGNKCVCNHSLCNGC